MTSERLYGILKFIIALDQKLGLQTKLEAVRDALSNITSQPAQPSYQSTLATALSAFIEAVAKMPESLNPSVSVAIEQMGGVDFFDPSIGEKVVTSVQTNAMTPSVARDFTQDIAARRSTFLETVRDAQKSLEKLKIRDTSLAAGSADASFIIPRAIFHNHLQDFAKELRFISLLVQDYTEAVTEKAEPVTLEQLSSSDPTVAILANLSALSLLGTVISKFLEAWERIQKIRRIRTEMTEMGVTGPPVEHLTETITRTVDTVVEESTQLVIANYKTQGPRRNELENAVRRDTERLFGQIERGLTVEFRAESKADSPPDDQKQLQSISNLAKVLKFPPPSNDPLLLTSGDVIEDNADDADVRVLTTTKKTVMRKATTSTKEPSKEGKDGKV